jgi:hypothetical protein
VHLPDHQAPSRVSRGGKTVRLREGLRGVRAATTRTTRPDAKHKSSQAGVSEQVSGRPYPERDDPGRDTASAWDRFAGLRPGPAAEPQAYPVWQRRMQEGVRREHPYLAGRSDTHRTRPVRRMSGSPPNYYALLGVPRNATQEQVEGAYRRSARLIHPDQFFLTDPPRHAVAQEKLKAVIAAMQVLRDPAERARYDAVLDGRPLAARIGPPPQDNWQGQAAPLAAERD